METLRTFQRRFLAKALDPKIDRAALSIPRGNGKSWLSARIVLEAIKPDGKLFQAAGESKLAAASMEQARIVFKFLRAELEDEPDYKFTDSQNRIAVTHVPTRTRVSVIGGTGRTAMGLGADTPVVVCDEPGSWRVQDGELLADAIDTALGKPGAAMKVIYVGTLHPAHPLGWWPRLIATGSTGTTYVQACGHRSRRSACFACCARVFSNLRRRRPRSSTCSVDVW